MRLILIIIIFFLPLAEVYSQQVNITKYQQKRINSAINNVFKQNYTTDTLFKDKNHNYYKILNNETLIGYYVFAEAYAMGSKFDYFYITSVGKRILYAEVLTFRSIKGGQIKDKSWMSQFIGYDGNNKLEYGVNVDAISGATKSAESLIEDIRTSLIQLKNK